MKDPYVYENTDILVNKLDIKDGEVLEKAESDFLIIAVQKLKTSGFEINSIFDCLQIHKLLFDNLYSWAGELRTIDIYKGEPLLNGKSIDYVFASYLKQALTDLNNEFVLIDWFALSNEEKIDKICYFVSEFWHIHPFREGNTRTSAMMLYFLIKKANLHINIDFLSSNAKYFRNSLVLSSLYSQSKKEYLLGLVTDSVSFKNVNTAKYETINGVEVKKYSYSNHTLNKLETIKKPENWLK